MSRPVRVSTIQLPARPLGETPEEKKLNNLRSILRHLEIAGKRHSDVAVYGESANHLGLPFDRENLAKYADPVPGPFEEEISRVARKHSMNIIAPLIGRVDGTLRNVALVIDRKGERVGMYFKTHLPAPEADAGIVQGEDLPVFQLDFGKVGVMICMDIEYPEVPLCLMLRGAEIIFFPHVQSSWGEVDWEMRYRSRAVDTGTYLVSACYGVGDEEAWMPGMMIGRSGIIGPDGMILAEASRYVEVLTRDVDLDRKRISNFHFARLCERSLAVRASRRPELYSLLCDPATRKEAQKEAKATIERLEAKKTGHR
jgi:predicted amidohydrolase